MKRLISMIVPALICGLMLTSCNSEDGEVITLSNGQTLYLKNFPWLKGLIQKAETDKTGNCIGCIWMENYKGKDIFVTNMGLGSGGIMYWFFDSSGNHFVQKTWGYKTCPACNYVGNHHVFFEDVLEDLDSFVLNIKKDALVYSSLRLCE